MTMTAMKRSDVRLDREDDPVEVLEVGSQDEFLARMYPKLVATFAFNGFTHEEAEDFAQDTLVRVVQHWEAVASKDHPEAWVYRTGMNVSRSWLRRLRVARRHLPELLDRHSDDDLSVSMTVRAALQELPRRQREALVLRFYAQLPVREAAEAMGCAEGTVRALTAQGVSALRERIGTELKEIDR